MASSYGPSLKKLQAGNWCRRYVRRQAAPVTNEACSAPDPFEPNAAGAGYFPRRPPVPSPERSRAELATVSRAQRVGILDHIGSAAGRGARGKQHKARGREHAGREIAAYRQVIRDILGGGIAQARQRYMRGEFPALRIEPDALHHSF